MRSHEVLRLSKLKPVPNFETDVFGTTLYTVLRKTISACQQSLQVYN